MGSAFTDTAGLFEEIRLPNRQVDKFA